MYAHIVNHDEFFIITVGNIRFCSNSLPLGLTEAASGCVL